ncbi:MAG TPA: hypothetical protein HA282_01470 [Nanoarchaeota archaeon]|nr:MAG: hypothetical protein QT01_C0003G0036 [archaeon GW2011_AR6]MBS3082965.1 hypothetical protein [Candidatus Pacearchaeota archaeon]HIH34782.1 hypothetical protein [Nanoarchaeota archaeon]HIH51214.1 hypothetical protein [Nanoarchaeota archaeon]HIH65868.1 hypothetical protein [Nanoarchaeota archaeon]
MEDRKEKVEDKESNSSGKERETIELDDNFKTDVSIVDPIGVLKSNLPVIRKDDLERMMKEAEEAKKAELQKGHVAQGRERVAQKEGDSKKSPGFFGKLFSKFGRKGEKDIGGEKNEVKNENTDSKKEV